MDRILLSILFNIINGGGNNETFKKYGEAVLNIQ